MRNFVTVINELFLAVQTPEYKQTLKQSILDKQSDSLSDSDFENVLAQAKQKIPIFSFIENYFWLFAAISIISLFFLLANVIFKPLGTVYAIALTNITKIVNNIEKDPQEPPQEPPPQNQQQPPPQPQPNFEFDEPPESPQPFKTFLKKLILMCETLLP